MRCNDLAKTPRRSGLENIKPRPLVAPSGSEKIVWLFVQPRPTVAALWADKLLQLTVQFSSLDVSADHFALLVK